MIGHSGAEWMGAALENNHRLALTGFALFLDEIWVVAAALGLAVLAGLFPAWRAYRNAVPELSSRA